MKKLTLDTITLHAPPIDHLLLYAITSLQRRSIVEACRKRDECLENFLRLKVRLNVWDLLDNAHALVLALDDEILMENMVLSLALISYLFPWSSAIKNYSNLWDLLMPIGIQVFVRSYFEFELLQDL